MTYMSHSLIVLVRLMFRNERENDMVIREDVFQTHTCSNILQGR